jgi:Mg-chelatase subunit ChlD
MVGHLLRLVKWGLLVLLVCTPLAHGSNIQVSADGSYAPPHAQTASDAGDTDTDTGTDTASPDTLSRIAPVRQSLEPAASPRDLVFVIDNSGSMKKNDPSFTIKQVVFDFMEQLSAGDRCGIVIFDTRARLVAPLLTVQAAGALNQLSGGLEQVDYRGQRTDSPAGIERAIYELRTAGREDAAKSIIFLTDGLVDTGSAQSDADKTRWLREDLTAESRRAGIRIFGVAFTENADFQLIQSLAMKTDGAYYRALDAEGMSDAFNAIAARLAELEAQKAAEAKPAAPESQPQAPSAPVKLPAYGGDTPGAATPPAVEDDPAAVQPATVDTAASSGGAVALRGMWKIYLPLFIIALLLISVLAFMILKLRGARGPLARRIFDLLPGAEGEAATAKVPEAQLIDLNHACVQDEGPLFIGKMQTTIGRDPRNDVVIDQPTISGFHACITFERDRFEIEDYRSTNGSFVNDLRLEADTPRHLKTGDTIKFADFEFRFMRLDRIPDDQTVMLSSVSLPEETFIAPAPEAPLPAEEMGAHFATVLSQQLDQISALGEPFARFVEGHLDPFTQNLLGAKVSSHLDEDATGAYFASDVLHRPPIAFKLCQLPVSPQDAAAWFEEAHGGFLSFLEEILDREVQQQPGCDTLCLISYGWKETPWVSLSIVPAGEGDHPVEIMSVEFLTPKEVAMLGLEFDENGRILSSIHTRTGLKANTDTDTDADAAVSG